MCHVIQRAYRRCRHHHHWEVAIPCEQGFDGTLLRCNVGTHEVIRCRYLPRPLCCIPCLGAKIDWLNQAFYVMLIRLKAATMNPSISDAELNWRFRTWRIQSVKETYRLTWALGYDVANVEAVGNVNEDEVDVGWHYPVTQEELHAQLSDLNERIDRGDEYAALDFWFDRPDTDEEAQATIADNSTEREVEATDEGHEEMIDDEDQEMTEEGESENEGEADNSTEGEVEAIDGEDEEMTDEGEGEGEGEDADKTEEEDDGGSESANDEISVADLQLARTLLDILGPPETVTSPAPAEPDPSSEGPDNGTPRSQHSHSSLHSLFEEPQPNNQDDGTPRSNHGHES